MLSRNSESSRAIPPELQIERVLEDPYVPEFAGRVKGMGVGEELDGYDYNHAVLYWYDARDAAVEAARGLLKLNVAKDQVNRLLEPFMWHTVIVTATDWDNFFALRDHDDAAPAFRKVARMMRVAMNASVPREIPYGGWHLPLVSEIEEDLIGPFAAAAASAGRCARSSYSNHRKPETGRESMDRWLGLSGKGHWSPGEHPACCVANTGYLGNFRGWKQLRKFSDGEAVFQG